MSWFQTLKSSKYAVELLINCIEVPCGFMRSFPAWEELRWLWGVKLVAKMKNTDGICKMDSSKEF